MNDKQGMIMLDFYTLQKTLTALSNDEHTYTATDIATLCRAGKLIPLFSYNRFVVELQKNDDSSIDLDPSKITPFNGYLGSRYLIDLLDGYKETVDLCGGTVFHANNYTDSGCDVMLVAHPFDYNRYQRDDSYIPIGDDDILTVTSEQLLFSREQVEVLAGQTQINESSTDKELIAELQAKVAELTSQLAQAEAKLTDKPADSITQSNTDIHNIKKEVIKQFNKSLATVLIDLDYKSKLRKGDIANYIMPYMKELAFVLADEQQDKADNLTVTYDTLYDNHLKNLGFKQGRQSDDEKQKVNIDLLFKKQLPITEQTPR